MYRHHNSWKIRTFFARGLAFVALVVVAGSLGGCPGDAATTPTTVDVDIQNLAYAPKEVTIQKGDTVRWTNRETTDIMHSVISGEPEAADEGVLFHSLDLAPGDTYEHPFNEAGEFTYHCHHHHDEPGMIHAKVTVLP